MNLIEKSIDCEKCIKTDNCNFKTRNEFNDNCLPFINLPNSNANILNWDLTNYIYYDADNVNNYYFDKNFKLIKFEGKLPIYSSYNLSNFELKKDSSHKIKLSSKVLAK